MTVTELERVKASTGDSDQGASSRLSELVRFLRHVNVSGTPQVPSEWVDEAWHTMLEDEVVYSDFLTKHGLSHVRHVPGSTPPAMYARTRAAMLEQGGIDLAWPEFRGAQCEGCSGDGGGSPD